MKKKLLYAAAVLIVLVGLFNCEMNQAHPVEGNVNTEAYELAGIELQSDNSFMLIISDNVNQESIPVMVDADDLFRMLSEAYGVNDVAD